MRLVMVIPFHLIQAQMEDACRLCLPDILIAAHTVLPVTYDMSHISLHTSSYINVLDFVNCHSGQVVYACLHLFVYKHICF